MIGTLRITKTAEAGGKIRCIFHFFPEEKPGLGTDYAAGLMTLRQREFNDLVSAIVDQGLWKVEVIE